MASQQCSSLANYLHRNGCFVRGRTPAGAEGPELTHTLMNGAYGGKISVRENAIDGFFAAYGEDLSRGQKLYVIERRSEVFNMHFDCDFKNILSDELLRKFVIVVQSAVAKYFCDDEEAKDAALPTEAKCIVCAVLSEDGLTRKAPGVHLMFPFAPVDEPAALWIRAGVVYALCGLQGFEGEDWSKVIDVCVLTTSGLRMVGSDKCKTCSSCLNSQTNRPLCAQCGYRGKVPENKIYWPYFAWPEDDVELQQTFANAKANPAHAARLCSTRRPKGTSVSSKFRVPPCAPPAATKKRTLSSGSQGDATDRIFALCDKEQKLPKIIRNSRILFFDQEKFSVLLWAIRKYHPSYDKLDIKEVREWKSETGNRQTNSSIVVKVAGFGSRFCLNKGADHTSQSIFFVVTPLGGISQHCFSRKEVLRKCGLCSSFASTPKPISSELRFILFGEAGQDAVRSKIITPSCRQQNEELTELQKSVARTAAVIAQLPSKLTRTQGTVNPRDLAALQVPIFSLGMAAF